MNPSTNLTYKRFGLLTAIDYGYCIDSRGRAKWRCLCDCGGKTYAYSHNLTSGRTTHCGCQPKTTARFVEHNGERRSIREWAEYLGLSYSQFRSRLYRNGIDKTIG